MTERVDFEAILKGSCPRFAPCLDCQEMTTGGARCFDCARIRETRDRMRDRMREAIPEGFRWARFGAPELAARVANRGLIARAEQAVAATRVLLSGLSGSGKTSLACAMAQAWSEHCREPASFALATDLASARSRERLGSEAQIVRDALRAPLLIVDDLGTDRDSPSSAIVEVIFSRHARQMPTWVTTWTSHEQRVARYGDGFARRIIEGARILDCTPEAK